MNDSDQIDEWIQEVEERPSSAAVILRFIAKRLLALTSRNEELLAENIELRSGRKVEEYETRITNLEYQLDMLKRQLNGDFAFDAVAKVVEAASLIAYLPQGNILRFDCSLADISAWKTLACLPDFEPSPWMAPRLVVTSPYEEVLLVFDSGRTIAVAVAELTLARSEEANWKQGYLADPRGGEELVAVLPIGKMTLFDFCLQTSRRGCARKMMKASFESHVSKGFVGTGVKQKPDRTGAMVLSGKDETLVLVSWEGFLTSAKVESLSFSAEEMLRLSATDHIQSSFVVAEKPSIIAVTRNGKVVVREPGWLELSTSGKSRGQSLFSQSRRDAGVRVAGSAAVDTNDWGAVLLSDGRVTAFPIAGVLASGSLEGDFDETSVVDFALFGVPVQTNEQAG